MFIRAIRGATTVERNTKDDILSATEKLLIEMKEKNGIHTDDMASILFSVTKDLNSVFPAAAARNLGWTSVPLMCTNEIDVPGSLELCIRIMLHFNTEKRNEDIKHIYLNNAVVLRPDLAAK